MKLGTTLTELHPRGQPHTTVLARTTYQLPPTRTHMVSVFEQVRDSFQITFLQNLLQGRQAVRAPYYRLISGYFATDKKFFSPVTRIFWRWESPRGVWGGRGGRAVSRPLTPGAVVSQRDSLPKSEVDFVYQMVWQCGIRCWGVQNIPTKKRVGGEGRKSLQS